MADTLLRIENIKKFFHVKRGFPVPETVTVRAVDGVSFEVKRGRAFGVVGESGCGKSTLGRSLLRLIEPDSGSVTFDGQDVLGANPSKIRALRQRMQIIFQDPYSSLNPRKRIGAALAEPLLVQGLAYKRTAHERVLKLLDEVGLHSDAADRFPHEFSGGQRQRIGIARALTVGPELIVADEPVSALDVSIQAQILLLLRELQKSHNLSFVFISHDLGVVRFFCQDMAVMYLGRIVETGPIPRIFEDPLHPYTHILRDASPMPDPNQSKKFIHVEGEVPSAVNPPSGCHFHPRCPHAADICKKVSPDWHQVDAERGVACHLFDTGNTGHDYPKR
jgi:peptide/nickel transport system ATP-binding protein